MRLFSHIAYKTLDFHYDQRSIRKNYHVRQQRAAAQRVDHRKQHPDSSCSLMADAACHKKVCLIFGAWELSDSQMAFHTLCMPCLMGQMQSELKTLIGEKFASTSFSFLFFAFGVTTYFSKFRFPAHLSPHPNKRQLLDIPKRAGILAVWCGGSMGEMSWGN